jgi:hypothetical protein
MSSNKRTYLLAGGAGALAVLAPIALAQTSFLTLSDYFVEPGGELTVRGGNFDPGVPVELDLPGEERTVIPDERGSFTAGPFVPELGDSDSRLEIKAEQGGRSAEAVFEVAGFYPVVEPNEYFFRPGQAAAFEGEGFGPGEQVEVRREGDLIARVNADDRGFFRTGPVAMGYDPARATFSFHGVATGAETSRTLVVGRMNAWIVLSDYYDPAGSGIEVRGFDFGAGEQVTVLVDGTPAASAMSDGTGRFAVQVEIPPAATGRLEISAKGESSGLADTEVFTVAAWLATD